MKFVSNVTNIAMYNINYTVLKFVKNKLKPIIKRIININILAELYCL